MLTSMSSKGDNHPCSLSWKWEGKLVPAELPSPHCEVNSHPQERLYDFLVPASFYQEQSLIGTAPQRSPLLTRWDAQSHESLNKANIFKM